MQKNKPAGKSRPFDPLWVALPLGVALLAFAYAPMKYREPVFNLGLYAAGRAEGCDLGAVWNSVEVGMLDAGERIARQVRLFPNAPEDEGLVHFAYQDQEMWVPQGHLYVLLLAEQELNLYQSGDVHVRQGDVALDCGANVGTFTRTALRAGASKVVAIEPSPENVASLRRTFAAEIAEGRVIVVPKGVWHEPDVLTLNVYENSLLDSFVMTNRYEGPLKGTVEVPLVTIDSLVTELGLERVDFIKMDIEGAEANALRGAAQVIRRDRPRMAIAAENQLEDVDVLPLLVAELDPGYQPALGACRKIGLTELRPEVIYFQPPTGAKLAALPPR